MHIRMYHKLFIYISSCLDFSHLLIAFVPFLEKLRFFSGIFSMENRIGFMVSQLQSLQFKKVFQRDCLSLSRSTVICLFTKNKSELLEFHSKFPQRIRTKPLNCIYFHTYSYMYSLARRS
jgi:hypothetical protein